MNVSRMVRWSVLAAFALAATPVSSAPNSPNPSPSSPTPIPPQALIKRFETRDAVKGLDVMTTRYKACHALAGGTGEINLEISFTPSGAVASVNVLASELNNGASSCIARVMREAQMDPYSGKIQKVLYVARLP